VSWPDYVFDPNYELPTIEEVADYIEENNHLPGIPDAATMEKDGIDLTETNKMLVEQVEEQMLYIIELKKELEALKVEIEALKEGE
jgi:HD superfamily phosphohydrolase YqeK